MFFGGKTKPGPYSPQKTTSIARGRSDPVSDFPRENQLQKSATLNSENRKGKTENLLAGVMHAQCAVAGTPLLCFCPARSTGMVTRRSRSLPSLSSPRQTEPNIRTSTKPQATGPMLRSTSRQRLILKCIGLRVATSPTSRHCLS